MQVEYSHGVLALPKHVRDDALGRYLRGDWGRCRQSDRDGHAFRDGYLMACYGRNGSRIHIVTRGEVTVVTLADES